MIHLTPVRITKKVHNKIVKMEHNYINYRGYTGTIDTCPDDDIMRGRVLGVHDLICYTGNDLQALKASFRTSIDDYIYDMVTTFN